MGALQLNKVIIMTTAAAYIMGWGIYFILYVSAHADNMDYLGYVVAEGASKGLIWPYMVYAWLRFGAPIV